MKRSTTATLATWMVERFTFGHNREALAGDLLEEFYCGRSTGWYWRQVAIAIGLGLLRVARDYGYPLVFSAGWSTFYPFWRLIGRSHAGYSVPGRMTAFSWPYSTMLDIAGGIFPAVSFILLGLILYLISDPERLRTISPLRFIGSMSAGLSVLLTVAIGLLYHLKRPVMEVHAVTSEGFFSILHISIVSIPPTLSLLAAIVYASSPAPRLGVRQRSRRLLWAGGPAKKRVLPT